MLHLNLMFLSAGKSVLDIDKELFPNLPNLIAHIIATIIMVIFLAKKVYGPFKKFNENQAEEINKLLTQATEKNIDANKAKVEAQNILEDAKSKAQDIMIEASQLAERHKNVELEKAKTQIAQLHQNAEKSIEMEREKLKQDIEKEILQVSFAASRKIIGDKITQEENDKLVKQFIDEL